MITDDHQAVGTDTRTDALGTTFWCECRCGWFVQHVLTELDLLNIWRSHIVVATLESEIGTERASGALGTGPTRDNGRRVLAFLRPTRRPAVGWSTPPPPAPRHLTQRPDRGTS